MNAGIGGRVRRSRSLKVSDYEHQHLHRVSSSLGIALLRENRLMMVLPTSLASIRSSRRSDGNVDAGAASSNPYAECPCHGSERRPRSLDAVRQMNEEGAKNVI